VIFGQPNGADIFIHLPCPVDRPECHRLLPFILPSPSLHRATAFHPVWHSTSTGDPPYSSTTQAPLAKAPAPSASHHTLAKHLPLTSTGQAGGVYAKKASSASRGQCREYLKVGYRQTEACRCRLGSRTVPPSQTTEVAPSGNRFLTRICRLACSACYQSCVIGPAWTPVIWLEIAERSEPFRAVAKTLV
jgi:hypothetical protein